MVCLSVLKARDVCYNNTVHLQFRKDVYKRKNCVCDGDKKLALKPGCTTVDRRLGL